ncbi:hypothetical protein [Roseomonas rosulenta]|uniref:hypothetical protein n=1 Tax=Roseomonas rosulenta TaxID=2748667 RepID=UPI0018DEF1A5|nr:hypothetical protein [Roseomonas rosulenta]
MSGLRPALLLPLLALGCATDRGEEAEALMQQALFSTQASLALAGGGAPPRVIAPSNPHDAGPPPGAARQSGTAFGGTPAPAMPAAIPPALSPGPRQRGSAPPATAHALMGTGAEQLRRMLGEPALRRAEGEAEIWLYEAPSCRLDIVLYPQGGSLVVAHAAARAHGAAQGVTEASCLSAIATAPATLPWGEPGRRA